MNTPTETNLQEELAGLTELATRTIHRELGKASLHQPEHLEDVLQESFLKMYLRLRGGGRPIREPRVYFRAVCRNTARKHMKKLIRMQQMEEPWSEALEGKVQLPEEPLVDERPLILAALPKLSPRYRQILKMMYIEGLGPKEIQAALRCTDGALRTAKHRALKALREALKELLP